MELPNKKYQIIYADPPWETRYFKESKKGMHSLKLPYPVMADKDIVEMPIKSIIEDNAVLFLWCIDQKIKLLPKLFSSWGFELKCIAFIWFKKAKNTNGSNSPYPNFTRRSCEYCFLGTRGKIKTLSKTVEQFHSNVKEGHSKKPAIFRQEIVRLYGNLGKIELFARDVESGWDAWGNQVPNHCQKLLATEDA